MKPKMPKQQAATQAIHAAHSSESHSPVFSQGPVFASTYPLPGDPSTENPFQYGRFENPSWQALEAQIGELEKGHCVLFPSGMAAISAVLVAFSKQGDALMVPSDGYEPTHAFAQTYLQKFGVSVRAKPTLDLLDVDLKGVRLLLVENPSNPMLDIIDLSAVAEKAKAAGCLLVVDNTVATPLSQTPLSMGADLVLASGSKALNGHSDTLMGYVASKDVELINSIRTWRKLSGAIPGPMETFLVQRGLATLPMRLDTMCRNAGVVAEFLQGQAEAESSPIAWIRYPGLKSDPAHTLAKQQFKHFGFLITFDLGSETLAKKFLSSLQLITEATSFGGLHSMAERRARWQPGQLAPGIIRLSVGCEHPEDIIDDIRQALSTTV